MAEEHESQEGRRIFAKPPRRLSQMTTEEIRQWARQLFDHLKEDRDSTAGADDTQKQDP